jgi:hypothetical protein
LISIARGRSSTRRISVILLLLVQSYVNNEKAQQTGDPEAIDESVGVEARWSRHPYFNGYYRPLKRQTDRPTTEHRLHWILEADPSVDEWK